MGSDNKTYTCLVRHTTTVRPRSTRYGGAPTNVKHGLTRLFGLMATIICLTLFLQPVTSARAQTAPVLIVALGDSLTAGYNLALENAFPVKLEAALRKRGHDVRIHNAGVSGDTSSGALSRLDWALPEKTDGVIVELGANDALRGTDPETTRKGLAQLLSRLEERKLDVLLAGMLAPPNMGREFADAFNAIYPDLARQRDALLYPFFLDGVAANPELNLGDGMHPNAKGVDVIVERIVPFVEKLIARIVARRAKS